MPAPKQHILHFYQKPALGNSFINRFPVYNYRHTISAIGGFDTASCDIAVRSREEGQQFLDQYIGNRVAFYVDNPVEPIWEGFINRMTFSAGGVQYTISLDEMANRVTVTYTDPALSAVDAQMNSNANNTDSQGVYGIKHENIDIGYLRAGLGANALRDTVIAQRSWPKSSITRGQGAGLLHLELLGFWHTLGWEIWHDTSTLNSTIGAYVLILLAAEINGTTFFDSGDTTDVAANATTYNRFHIKRGTYLDTYLRLQEIGDATNYHVMGITPTLFSTGTRRLYYRPQNSAVEYTARQSDGLRIRNLYGQLVPPWTVQPDRGVRVSDMLIGWNGLGDNPAETYIKAVDYDANQQLAIYRGDDDTSSEAAFQLKRVGKPHGKRFGAWRRVI